MHTHIQVLKIIDLQDASGNPAPVGAVNVSDILLSVDGQSVENVSTTLSIALSRIVFFNMFLRWFESCVSAQAQMVRW